MAVVPRTLRRVVIRLAGIAATAIGLLALVVGIIVVPLTGLTRPGWAARADTPADLRVITFNFDGGNREHFKVSAWVRERQPDVLLLQETYPFATRVRQPLPALEAVLPYIVEQDTSRGYRGFSLMSRYPIGETTGYDADGAVGRTVIQMPTGDIAVYNVSLANPVSRATGEAINSPLDLLSGYDSSARDTQIRQLLTALESETLPYIVAGDHNLMEIESAYGWLSARLTDVFAAVGQGRGATWDAQSRLLLRIDYIWADRGWCPLTAEVGPVLGSDHLPVEAALARGSCP